jgi:uncharacterized protein
VALAAEVKSSPRRCALITGASSGIGAEFARQFAASGVDVVLAARRLDRLEALAAALATDFGVRAMPLQVDLAGADAPDTVMEKLGELAVKPDILVNNAGFSIAQRFLGVEWRDQRDFIQVTVTTATALCHVLLPAMIERRWGRIINVASMTAFSPGAPGHTLYPAGKSFLVKLSQSLASEVKPLGVNVTALCPGQTESEFADANGTRKALQGSGLRAQSTADVVRSGIRANEAGKEVIVTGFGNKVAVAAMKLLPDGLTAALIRPLASRFSLPDKH